MNAEETLTNHKLYYQYGPGYPFVVTLGALFIAMAKIFSVNDAVAAVNFMSVVFSSLCVLANYLLVKELLDEITALCSSILLSIYPIFLGVSVYGTSHTIFLFFLLIGIYFLLTHLRTGSRRHLFYTGLCLGMMGASRLQDMVLMAVPISFLYFFGFSDTAKKASRSLRDISKIKSYLLFLSLAICVILVFYIPLLGEQTRHQFNLQFQEFVNRGLTKNFRGLFSSSLKVSLEYFLAGFSFVGLLAAIFGLILLLKKNGVVFGFLTLWIFIPLFFYGNLWSTAPRFLIVSSIPLIITEGYFLSWMMKRAVLFRKIVFIIYGLIIFLAFSSIYPILKTRHKYALLPDFARWVASHTPVNSRVISTDDGLFINYYGHRSDLTRPSSAFFIDKEGLAKFKTNLDDILQAGITVYITSNGLYSYNPHYQFSNFMKSNYNLYFIGSSLGEDWHQGEISLRIGRMALFSVTRK